MIHRVVVLLSDSELKKLREMAEADFMDSPALYLRELFREEVIRQRVAGWRAADRAKKHGVRRR